MGDAARPVSVARGAVAVESTVKRFGDAEIGGAEALETTLLRRPGISGAECLLFVSAAVVMGRESVGGAPTWPSMGRDALS